MTTRPKPPPSTPLTPAELRILAGAARGRTDQQIANDLRISHDTVGTHLLRISARLGTTTRGAAVAAGYRLGYLTGLPAEPRPHIELTPEQTGLLLDFAAGRTSDQIARRLWLHVDSAKKRIRELHQVLGSTNRAHAVALAYQHGHLTATPVTTTRTELLGAAS